MQTIQRTILLIANDEVTNLPTSSPIHTTLCLKNLQCRLFRAYLIPRCIRCWFRNQEFTRHSLRVSRPLCIANKTVRNILISVPTHPVSCLTLFRQRPFTAHPSHQRTDCRHHKKHTRLSPCILWRTLHNLHASSTLSVIAGTFLKIFCLFLTAVDGARTKSHIRNSAQNYISSPPVL